MAFDLLDSIDLYFGKQMDYFVIDETNFANSQREMGYAKFEWLCLPSFVGGEDLKSWRKNVSSFLNSLANANRMVLNKKNGYALCRDNLPGPNISFSSERVFLLNNLRFASVKDGRIGSLRGNRKQTELKPREQGIV
ncbi:hypothetical protein M9434_001294 [Picochlorum sp. BPE23]|nr:hypothetical protein M9434_001294 [Picochlorum sp. BPE23]